MIGALLLARLFSPMPRRQVLSQCSGHPACPMVVVTCVNSLPVTSREVGILKAFLADQIDAILFDREAR